MMKKTMLVLGALFALAQTPAEAQFLKKLSKKLEKKLDRTTEQLEAKVDKKLDKMLDLGEDEQESNPYEGDQSQEMSGMTPDGMPIEMTADSPETTFASYSKYDFTPGTELIAFENFEADPIGDLPAHWNTNASAEVVTLSTAEGKWLRIGQGSGSFTFDQFPGDLPEDYTLEFDVTFDFEASGYAFKRYFSVLFSTLEDPNTYLSDFSPTKDYVNLSFTNGSGSGRYVALTRASSQKGMAMNSKNPHPFFSKEAEAGSMAHIAILKKGARLKVYINQDKVIDVPRAFLDAKPMKSIRFQSNISPNDQYFFIGNVKFATGVEIPERIFDSGSYQAHGIQFDSGSAQLKPTSFGTLKKIALAIQAHPQSSFMIVGHTDNDGDDAVNIPLSQARAEAVQQALVTQFDIEGSRLQVTGVGATQPLLQENTPTAKAQNRRVEIQKI